MRRFILMLPILAGAIAGAIVALAIGTGGSSKTVTETVVAASSGRSVPATASMSSIGASAATGAAGMSVNEIYKRDSPGVVDITVASVTSGSGSNSGGGLFGFGGGSSQAQEQEDEGAGVVYDKKGDIITDEHVVAGSDAKIEVHFQNGVNAPATIVGTPDASTDVAVIHVDVSSAELHPITFANSSTAQVGDPVVAIGSPFSLPETVTQGIVSAVGRSIQAPNDYTITGAIQTDAAINPGNSGGPLLDSDGDVLGLNDQIQTSSGDSAGVGFATPGDTDVQVADEMIAGKKVQHAYVGLCIQPPQTGSGAQIAPDASAGASIGGSSSTASSSCTSGPSVAAGSPAARAGLRAGDVITAVDGHGIASPAAFVATLSGYAPGDTVTFTIKRGGKVRTIKVTLGNRPASTPTAG